MRLKTALNLFLLIALLPIPANAEPRDKTLAGLDVLNQFLGVWKTETKIRNEGPPLREIESKGRATCQQTLEGRYFEFRTQSIIPPGSAVLQIMTYDEEKDVYRQWVFDSDGYHHQADGRWDAASSTLKWEGTAEETSFVIDDHWVSPDRLEWTLIRKDKKGRRLQTIEGVLIRVK